MLLLIGPIVLLVYVSFVTFVIKKVIKITKIENKVNRIFIVAILVVISYLIPFGDHHLGKYYFNNLCETDGGVTVYKTVTLPTSYFDSSGMLLEYKKIRSFNEFNINNKYFGRADSYYDFNKKFRIGLRHSMIFDNESNGLLSEEKIYYSKGGWLINSLGYEASISYCKDRKPDMLVKKTFLMEGVSKKQEPVIIDKRDRAIPKRFEAEIVGGISGDENNNNEVSASNQRLRFDIILNTNCPYGIGWNSDKSNLQHNNGRIFKINDKSYYLGKFKSYNALCASDSVYLYYGTVSNGKYYLNISKRSFVDFEREWNYQIVFPEHITSRIIQITEIRENDEELVLKLNNRKTGVIVNARVKLSG